MDGLVWLLCGLVVLALAIGAYLLLMRRGESAGETFLHFRCPGCKRRLRFRAGQAGHSGQCSHCGCKLTFPSASQASD
jgi:hypothetical protein